MTDLPYNYNIKYGMTAEVVQPVQFSGEWQWVIKNWRGQCVAFSPLHKERNRARKALEKFLFKVRHDQPAVRIVE